MFRVVGRNLLHEEILAFWKQQFLDKVASGIDLDTERRLVDVICKMDPEHNGFVTWKNFIDHESLKVLNKRNKVSMLSGGIYLFLVCLYCCCYCLVIFGGLLFLFVCLFVCLFVWLFIVWGFFLIK